MKAPRQRGIYVEIGMDAPLERVWQLTQQPSLHGRWDLRFSSIEYLPKASDAEPQQFLYETRIGFGLAIRGTGESVATRQGPHGDATSSLKFASDDRLSLIRQGSGYWRYVPTPQGLRFLTWYDYGTRFGVAGRTVDLLFRPLMGWATAWSFDRLRLWAVDGILPETSLQLSAVHGVCRVTLASVWMWHGLVPKLLFRDVDERLMLAHAGVAESWLPWIGGAEVAFGLLLLLAWRWRWLFPLQMAFMAAALAAVAVQSPAYLTHAFNPVTLNLLVIGMALAGWLASGNLPSATRCLRVPPETHPEESA